MLPAPKLRRSPSLKCAKYPKCLNSMFYNLHKAQPNKQLKALKKTLRFSVQEARLYGIHETVKFFDGFRRTMDK